MLFSVLSFLIAFLAVLWLHPKMVRIAREKGITDNPDRRKLQREPVPVLGGVSVFFGIVLGVGSAVPFIEVFGMAFILTLLTLMLYVGSMDDILGLTPRLRFLIEILAVLAAIFLGRYGIDNFHGLWGVQDIPLWVGVPLTLIASVGIINAVNLIDGVDGLSSGYCILACVVFGAYFYFTDDFLMLVLATACIGALIPFFYHNVFGRRLKMFIGDGGTLLMGMVLSIFVLRVLDVREEMPWFMQTTERTFGLIPFTLAVLSIPVFDTLRVMTRRMWSGHSPFKPDKTHLHHAFIGLGLSHIATTTTILTLNSLIVLGWFLLYRWGCSVDVQLYFVVASALLFTLGVYLAARKYRK